MVNYHDDMFDTLTTKGCIGGVVGLVLGLALAMLFRWVVNG